jgi:hypothetical protein
MKGHAGNLNTYYYVYYDSNLFSGKENNGVVRTWGCGRGKETTLYTMMSLCICPAPTEPYTL